MRVLFGVVPPPGTVSPETSPCAVPADVQTFDIPIPARHTDPVDADETVNGWLGTPNASFGRLCPRNRTNGTDDQRAFVASFLSSIEDGSFS